MKVLFSFIAAGLISSCSTIVSLYPSCSKEFRNGEEQWVHLETNEHASFDVYTKCYDEGRI